MKVFISWSGPLSHKIALILHDWLPSVIQAVEPFLSSEGTDKGSRWFNELSKELQDTGYGIICLTPDNLNAPWILFEAGALSKVIGSSRVCPLVTQLSPSDLQGPLAQFQATLLNKDDMRKLVKSINSALAEKGLNVTLLDKVFDRWWDEFEKRTSDAMAQLPGPPDQSYKRPMEDILEEVLTLCRSMAIKMSQDERESLVKAWMLSKSPSNPPLPGKLAEIAFPNDPSHTTILGRSALNPNEEIGKGNRAKEE
jgi:hypothetical protein